MWYFMCQLYRNIIVNTSFRKLHLFTSSELYLELSVYTTTLTGSYLAHGDNICTYTSLNRSILEHSCLNFPHDHYNAGAFNPRLTTAAIHINPFPTTESTEAVHSSTVQQYVGQERERVFLCRQCTGRATGRVRVTSAQRLCDRGKIH